MLHIKCWISYVIHVAYNKYQVTKNLNNDQEPRKYFVQEQLHQWYRLFGPLPETWNVICAWRACSESDQMIILKMLNCRMCYIPFVTHVTCYKLCFTALDMNIHRIETKSCTPRGTVNKSCHNLISPLMFELCWQSLAIYISSLVYH